MTDRDPEIETDTDQDQDQETEIEKDAERDIRVQAIVRVQRVPMQRKEGKKQDDYSLDKRKRTLKNPEEDLHPLQVVEAAQFHQNPNQNDPLSIIQHHNYLHYHNCPIIKSI